MNEILKGNFKTEREVSSLDTKEESSLEDRFEKEALKKTWGQHSFCVKEKSSLGREGR